MDSSVELFNRLLLHDSWLKHIWIDNVKGEVTLAVDAVNIKPEGAVEGPPWSWPVLRNVLLLFQGCREVTVSFSETCLGVIWNSSVRNAEPSEYPVDKGHLPKYVFEITTMDGTLRIGANEFSLVSEPQSPQE